MVPQDRGRTNRTLLATGLCHSPGQAGYFILDFPRQLNFFLHHPNAQLPVYFPRGVHFGSTLSSLFPFLCKAIAFTSPRLQCYVWKFPYRQLVASNVSRSSPQRTIPSRWISWLLICFAMPRLLHGTRDVCHIMQYIMLGAKNG